MLISRRSMLLGTSAAFLCSPDARANDADVVVVGAGAAGIGATRELRRAGKSVILVEARERAGGRVFTDTSLGDSFDAGAAYIHFSEKNPWSQIATDLGIDPQGGYRLWAGSIAYRDGVALTSEQSAQRWTAMRRVAELYEDVEDRYDRAMSDVWKDEPQDVKDAGRIQAQMAAGENPEWVSVADWNRLESGGNRLVPGGYGTLAARAAESLAPRLGIRVSAVDLTGPGVTLTTNKGTLRARAAIITVPVGVLKAGSIQFKPGLPLEHLRALEGMRMGALSKIALKFDGNRLGFTPHQFLAEIGDPTRAITFETWPQDQNIVLATLGGDYARTLAPQPEAAVIDHALGRFLKITGSDARKHFKDGRFANWSADPYSLGSYAVIRPTRIRSRDALARPIADRLWLAGEATAGNYAMTAGGAYMAGRDAARELARKLSTGTIR